MADFTPVATTTDTTLVDHYNTDAVIIVDPGGGSTPVVTEYLQRLWDTGLVAYVYYTRESTDPTTPPLAPGDTSPSNTGAFDYGNHAIIDEAP